MAKTSFLRGLRRAQGNADRIADRIADRNADRKCTVPMRGVPGRTATR